MTMNRQQHSTAIGCLIISTALFLLGIYALVVEEQAVSHGGSSTISEMFWTAWAHQPGPILLIALIIAFAIGFLFGHFFWQSERVYDDIRRGSQSDGHGREK